MDASELNLILWIPFLLVVVLSSIRFVISGFRRGFWLALIYLGVSLAAAAVSVPIARALAPATSGSLAPYLLDLLPAELPGGDAAVQGLLQMLGALLVYPLVFFLLALVARLVTGLLLRPLLTRKKFFARLGGLTVGILHAVVYPVLLLLPLYGTLAAFMPAVQALALSGEGQHSEEYAYVTVLAEHPVVKLAGTEAAQWYYKGLSSVELEGAALDLAGVSQSAEDFLTQYKNMQNADPTQRKAMIPGFLRVLENTLDTKWCYQLVCEVGLDKFMDPQEMPILGQWLVSLKGTSQEDYSRTVDALTALTDGLQADGTLELLLSGDDLWVLLEDPQTLTRLDTFLESTPQTQALKKQLFTESIAEFIFGGDRDAAGSFVAAVLADPDTRDFLSLTTIGALAGAETQADAARILLENENVNVLALAAILLKNDLLGKLDPDFAQLLPTPG